MKYEGNEFLYYLAFMLVLMALLGVNSPKGACMDGDDYGCELDDAGDGPR